MVSKHWAVPTITATIIAVIKLVIGSVVTTAAAAANSMFAAKTTRLCSIAAAVVSFNPDCSIS